MDESPPASSAAEPAAAPDENAAQEKPRRERRRLRVPTSVIVTVLVAAFSVWVAPAFARQWDDRQKARELKAAVANEIATATTRTITAGIDIARAQQARFAATVFSKRARSGSQPR